MTVVRVLLVDDQAPLLRAISAALEEIPGVEVVGEASWGKDSILASAALLPGLVLERAAGGRDATLVGQPRTRPSRGTKVRTVAEIISSITTCGDPRSSPSLLASGHEELRESENPAPW
jgi:DNA-binding NarL/FixJ family response regulator